jgi:hypothetical protein
LEDKNKDIDQLLFSQLSDASMDETGIDWNAFNKKRRRKRIVFWLFSFFGLVVITGLSLLLNEFTGNEKNNRPGYIVLSNPSKTSIAAAITDTTNVHSSSTIPASNQESKGYVGSSKTKQIAVPTQSTKIKEVKLVYLQTDSVKGGNEEKNPSQDEINMASKKLVTVFNFIKPFYTAEKVAQNALPYPVFPIKNLKLYWEIQAGPSLNIPNFKVSAAGKSFIHKDYEGIRKLSETAESGYNLQLSVGRTMKRWSYGIGFGLSSFNIKGNYDFNYSEKPVIDVDGKIENYFQASSVNIQFSSRQKLSFIEVPVNIQYLFIDKEKFGAGVRLGYFNQFLSSIHGQLPNAVFLDERENMTTENFKIRTSSLQAGLQLHYKINAGSSLILMPEYRKGMGFSQIQSYYKTNYSYWGINLNYRKTL